jgi:Rrf2 family protein
MLRFTKRADYGLMAIHYIAIHDDLGAVSAKRIAEEFAIPQELLAKILQRLAKQGLIVSQNGPKGGYVLSRRPSRAWRITATARRWSGAACGGL